MSRLKFLTIIETGQTSFGAFAPDIPGCIAFSTNVDELKILFKLAAESHLRELFKSGDHLPHPETQEIPGLTVGSRSGAITLEWTTVELPLVTAAA